jgi:hypothetical protein
LSADSVGFGDGLAVGGNLINEITHDERGHGNKRVGEEVGGFTGHGRLLGGRAVPYLL